MTTADAILEFWDAAPSLALLRSVLLERSRLKDRKDLSGDEVFDETVWSNVEARHAKLLVAQDVGPHTDPWFPPWSALLILQRDDGHILHVADHTPREPNRRIFRKPAKKITQSVPLAVDQIVLFNAHRTHWLDAGKNAVPFIGLSLDFKERPSREQVQAGIEAIARNFSALRKVA